MKFFAVPPIVVVCALIFSVLPAQAEFNPLISTNGLDPNQQAIVAPINSTIPPFGDIPTLAADLEGLPAGAVPGALNELSPEQFSFFTSTLAFNNATFNTQAMDAYLANSRLGPNGTFIGGNSGIDFSGLTVNDPNFDPSLSMVHSKMLAWNPAPLPNGVLSDMASDELGGLDMKDDKEATTLSYGNPWHTFVRGNVVLAQSYAHQDVTHFNYTTSSVVLGTDYRITPNFLLGLTASFAHTDATFNDGGSSATVDSYSPGLYASYADAGWYANAIGSYVHDVYTQSRRINFLSQTSTSDPNGNEGIADLDGGYEFHRGALKFGPLAGLQYTHLEVDGYNESGSLADLNVQSSAANSLRSRFGGDVSYTFRDGGISIIPRFSAAYQHDFMDQGRGVTSAFNAGGGSFIVQTPQANRDSALLELGVDADLNRTISIFTTYIVQAGEQDYLGQSVQAGVKFGF